MLIPIKADLLFTDPVAPHYLYGIATTEEKIVLWRLDVSSGDAIHEPTSVLLPASEAKERLPEAILAEAIVDGAFDT